MQAAKLRRMQHPDGLAGRMCRGEAVPPRAPLFAEVFARKRPRNRATRAFASAAEGLPTMEEDKFGSAVDAMLRETASTYGAPAFGWRIRRRGRLHEGVHGTRDMTQPDPASLQDRWHWGSCAKSVCAVVCAVLVDAGTVPGGWSTPLSALDKTFAGAPYEHVTMEQVLAHRSGASRTLAVSLR